MAVEEGADGTAGTGMVADCVVETVAVGLAVGVGVTVAAAVGSIHWNGPIVETSSACIVVIYSSGEKVLLAYIFTNLAPGVIFLMVQLIVVVPGFTVKVLFL